MFDKSSPSTYIKVFILIFLVISMINTCNTPLPPEEQSILRSLSIIKQEITNILNNIPNKESSKYKSIEATLVQITQQIQDNIAMTTQTLSQSLKKLGFIVEEIPNTILPKEKTNVSHEKSGRYRGQTIPEKITQIKFSLFLEIIKELNIDNSNIHIRYGQTSTQLTRQESYIAIEISDFQKTILLSRENSETTFIHAGHLSNEILISLGKKSQKDQSSFMHKFSFKKGKEKEWKETLKVWMKKDSAIFLQEKNTPLLQKMTKFFNTYPLLTYTTLTKKERAILNVNLQNQHGITLKSLCKEFLLNIQENKYLDPLSCSNDMMILIDFLYNKPTILKENREKRQRQKAFEALSVTERKNQFRQFIQKKYPATEWMNLQKKQLQALEAEIYDEYNCKINKIFSLFQISEHKPQISCKKDWLNLGKEIFNDPEVFQQAENKIKQKDLFKNDVTQKETMKQLSQFLQDTGYSVDKWMLLTRSERKKLNQHIYKKYNMSLRTLCTTLGITKIDQRPISPIRISEYMLLIGEKIFGTQTVFDTIKIAMNQYNTFKKLQKNEQKIAIQQLLLQHNILPNEKINPNTDTRRSIEKIIFQTYFCSLYLLAQEMKITKEDTNTINPRDVKIDIIIFLLSLFPSNIYLQKEQELLNNGISFKRLQTDKQIHKINTFLKKHHINGENFMFLSKDQRIDLNNILYSHYRFGLIGLCHIFGITKNKTGKKLDVSSATKSFEPLGKKIFAENLREFHNK
ncbi:hypothetical protein COB57_04060 [Candidatus Peregrinibacteria bacterium]|nr:MAG: hypothetical protein COB57_04060 [Candidatus Peregrinibacteria bacterium]